MPNGKPHDHPITDIIIHNYPTFSLKADGLIKQIHALGGRRQLDELCDWFRPPPVPDLEKNLQALLDQLSSGSEGE